MRSVCNGLLKLKVPRLFYPSQNFCLQSAAMQWCMIRARKALYRSSEKVSLSDAGWPTVSSDRASGLRTGIFRNAKSICWNNVHCTMHSSTLRISNIHAKVVSQEFTRKCLQSKYCSPLKAASAMCRAFLASLSWKWS